MMRIYLLLIMIFMTAAISAQDKHLKKIGFDPGADPAKDLQKAVIAAQADSKRIILDVGGEWCIWCHRLDEFLHADSTIMDILQKQFVVVKVNFSRKNKNAAFLSNYPAIEGYPHIFVLESDGAFLHSQNTGELEENLSYDKEKVLAFLNTWSKQVTAR